MNESNKRINIAKRHRLMLLVTINLVCVGHLLLVLFNSKKEDAFVNIMIAASISWLPCNIIIAFFLYFWFSNSKLLGTIKSSDDMGERDRKYLIRTVALLCIPNVLGIVVIIKGAVLFGCVICCVSLFAFIYYQKYQKKLLKKSRKTEDKNPGY